MSYYIIFRHLANYALMFLLGLSISTQVARADLSNILGVDDIISSIDSVLETRLDQFFQEFDSSAAQLVSRGATEGSVLLVQAGNQMRMTSITAAHALEAHLDTPIGRLSDQAQNVISTMFEMQRRVEQGLEESIALTDMLVINLERILDEANPLAEQSLYIYRVVGLVVPPTTNALGHRVVLRGPGFGGGSLGESVSFSVSIGGEPLHVVPTSVGINTDAAIQIPDQILERYREDEDLTTVPIEITVSRTTDGWFWGWFGRNVETTPTMTLDLIFIPRTIGWIHAEITRPVYSWVPHPSATYSLTRELLQPSLFTDTVPRPSVGAQPQPGEMRWNRESVVAQCDSELDRHRQLLNGQFLPLSHQYFTEGWMDPRGGHCVDWMFDGQPSRYLWTIVDRLEADTGIGGQLGLDLVRRYSSFRRSAVCRVNASALLEASAIRNGCDYQSFELINFSTFGETFSLQIAGGIPNGAPFSARWNVTAQAEIYAETGETEIIRTPLQPVRDGGSVTVDLDLGVSPDAAIRFIFESSVVPGSEFLASRPGIGFDFHGFQSIGSDRRVTFGYSLPLD